MEEINQINITQFNSINIDNYYAELDKHNDSFYTTIKDEHEPELSIKLPYEHIDHFINEKDSDSYINFKQLLQNYLD